ncbi:hypothetical protein FACS1894200_14050 [Spirochaetia bacterium]|nr:hypothetical protein FACS1894200_14050 [Spirochaetia bacterium]
MRMAELQKTLDLLNYKIEHYDTIDSEAVKKFSSLSYELEMLN